MASKSYNQLLIKLRHETYAFNGIEQRMLLLFIPRWFFYYNQLISVDSHIKYLTYT